jgi:hypothetical protein
MPTRSPPPRCLRARRQLARARLGRFRARLGAGKARTASRHVLPELVDKLDREHLGLPRLRAASAAPTRHALRRVQPRRVHLGRVGPLFQPPAVHAHLRRAPRGAVSRRPASAPP